MIAVILMVLSSISNTGLWVTVVVDVVIVVGGVVDVLVVVLGVVVVDVVCVVVVGVVLGDVLGPITFKAGSKYVETSSARLLKRLEF